ncbi:hypothetical protein [Methylomonas albis]|uniref:EF-hand domain-containing protein n=1 Tax=Methylomonas albis TaxID=1854563 RepID=A0ABR9CXD8_9GAMM|nr:hypothetical protein [Methylomonas albis]MBD9355543.1 hypothetical protein [Methylomonas albis]
MPLESIANSHEPITLDSLEIELENYSSFYDTRIDGTIPMPELCKLLSQQWAQKICQKGRIIDYALYLRRFTLVKADDLGTISYIDGATESTGQMVKKMSLDETPSLFCDVDKQGKPLSLCPVAMKVSDNLLAVWIVGARESGNATIAKQAQVIRALLQFAFGEFEDTQALYTALQGL